jgi:2-oxoglutarate ferredoxin oxidoreductase subunit delta
MARVVIDDTKCKSCYLCIDACPKKVLKISDKTGKTGNFVVKFQDDEGKCTGCKSCATVCPDLAITEVYR